MIKYDLRTLVPDSKKRRGTEIVLPAVHERLGVKRQYERLLNRMLRQMAKNYRESVLPALNFQRSLTIDEESWFTRLETDADATEAEILAIVGGILTVESLNHTKKFILSVDKSLGVDLAAIVRNEDLGAYLRDAVARNAALIKSLKQDAVKDIRRLVFQAKIDGRSAKSLSKEIAERFEVHANRAKLIAEDQINKLTADLNRLRQAQAGVKTYRWQTSRDERVRPRHRNLHRTEYRWGEPTGAEGGLPPGQPVRCRCSARAVIEF